MNMENQSSQWCIIANVVEKHLFGEGSKQTKKGTKHFRPQSKVYIFGLYSGECTSVMVVGRHRGSNKYVTMVMQVAHLENFRPKVVYSPEVIRRIREAPNKGLVRIQTENEANEWIESLLHW